MSFRKEHLKILGAGTQLIIYKNLIVQDIKPTERWSISGEYSVCYLFPVGIGILDSAMDIDQDGFVVVPESLKTAQIGVEV